MSMRISEAMVGAGLLCLALASCGGGGATPDGDFARSNGRAGVADCISATGSGWSRSCLVERDGDLLTLRHSDGGFRRLRIVRDGRGVITADGAELVTVNMADKGQIELSIGAEGYRLPATVAGAVVKP